MKIDKYLTELRINRNIAITVDDEEVKIVGDKENLTREVIEDIKIRKGEILAYFKSLKEDKPSFTISPAEKAEYYKSSSAQKRLYFIQGLNKTSTAYNLPLIVKLEGKLDIQQLEHALKKLINRHESFRTSFEIISGEIFQKIHEQPVFEIQHFKSSLPGAEDIINKFIRPFDLGNAPLIRIGLIEISSDEHVLISDIHHIISDGVSLGILAKEFMALYSNEELPPLKLHYKDYAEWQQGDEQTGFVSKQKDFWLNQFSKEVATLSLPLDFDRPMVKDSMGDSVKFEIGAAETAQLKLLAKKEGATMFMVMLSVYNVLLSKFSNQEDIVIGTATAGRLHADLDATIGMFVNTLPIRNFPIGEMRFRDFLAEVKTTTLSCFDNQAYPYEQLINELNIERDTSRNPLFDVLFAYQNYEQPELVIPGLSLKPYNKGYIKALFDLELNVFEVEERIALDFTYCTRLFEKSTINRFAEGFKMIVSSILSDTNIQISDISILSADERNELLYTFNDTETPYSKEETIISLFEQQALQTPHNTAIIYGAETISYQELKTMSDQVATYLAEEAGVVAGDLVGVMLERENYLLPAIYGILKAGAAYVPIDPHYPAERTTTIIEDSGLRVIITRGKYLHANQQAKTTIIDLDTSLENIRSHEIKQPATKITGSNLAYVIYTSGSTGKPKGVMIEHHSVINRLQWMQKAYPLTTSDVLLQKTPIVFDVSVWELFWWSFTGASLCLLEAGGEKDPQAILKTINRHKISTIHFVPSMLSPFLSAASEYPGIDLSSLRQVFASGEALKPEQVNTFGAELHKQYGTRLINLYGPTEATVDVTHYECTFEEETRQVPIGQPIDNTSLYIVDKNNELVPIGVPGELCIGGAGVARGYLNNDSLTREKFIELRAAEGKRVYKTGDLASWQPDGNIEYLGRLDHQVKIRGYRVELGEIENVLLGHPSIKEVVVLINERGDAKYLVAYYVSENELAAIQLTEYLQQKLPAYMVPQYFLYMEAMPLTINGKIDRKALLALETAETSVYYAPRSVEESIMCEIWADALSLKKVSIRENFFSIGGDSIKAIKVVYETNKRLKCNLDLADFYACQTIERLSDLIPGRMNEEQEAYLKAESEIIAFQKAYRESNLFPDSFEEVYPMSEVEKGMIFYTMLKEKDEKNFHNILYHEQNVYPVAIKDFQFEIFEQAIRLLIDKHGELRKVFDIDHFAHVIKKHIEPELHYLDISGLPGNEQEDFYLQKLNEERIRASGESNTLLWRMNIMKISEDFHYLVFDMHHSLLDGWSLHALLTELNNTYLSLKANPGYVPGKLKCDYRDHIISEIMAANNTSSNMYWRNELEGYTRFTLFETGQEHKYVTKFFDLGKDLKRDLEALASKLNTSLKHLCFAAYIYTMRILGNKDDIVVGVTTNNRPLVSDGEKLLGCFLNSVPVRINISDEGKWVDYIQYVDDKLRRLKKHDRVPFSKILEIIDEPASKGNPIFDFVFNYIDFWIVGEMINDPEAVMYDPGFAYDNRDVNQNTFFDFHIRATLEDFKIHMEYSTTILDEILSEKFCVYFKNVLCQFVENVNGLRRIDSILSFDEWQTLLYKYNSTERDYPGGNVLTLFDQQAEATPGQTALYYRDKEISYKQLKEQSEQVARYLQQTKHIKRGDLVGLMLERDEQLVPVILGIIRSGAAYVPIDPRYPAERIQAIIEDSGIKALITRASLVTQQQITTDHTDLDTQWPRIMQHPPAPVETNLRGTDLAYVIYTSGSTGKPKGVMIEHQSLHNYISWAAATYTAGEPSTFPLYTTISFDLTITTIFTPLVTGGSIAIYGENTQHTLIEDIFNDTAANTIKLTPSHLKILRELDLPPSTLKNEKRKLIVGGEQLTTSLARAIHDKFGGNIEIYNEYGPTEATIGCMIHKFDPRSTTTNVPIGQPISNSRIYILDKTLQPVPCEVTGELYISGKTIARGYLHNPTLTAEKFIPNPYVAGEKMYKTGDQARRHRDGTMEYLGRLDQQVKIRGYRIELGEIESHLSGYSSISQSVVQCKEKGTEKHLVAYYVSETPIPQQTLIDHLAGKLPSYMVPASYVHLTTLPLTPNGKLDHKALPEPGQEQTNTYTPPVTKEEKLLSSIWSQVLGVENISTTDNYFSLGGDSIRSIQISSRVRHAGYELSVKDIFTHPSISQQALRLKPLEHQSDQTTITGQSQLTPIQRWFFESPIKSKHHYNQSVLLHFPQGIDKTTIQKIFTKLQAHHDALRIIIKKQGGVVVMENQDTTHPVYILEHHLGKDETTLSTLCETLQSKINLETGPLMQLGLYHLQDSSRLQIVIHHLVVDGISWRILFEDIETLYRQLQQNQPLSLPPKTDPYLRWSAQLQTYQQTQAHTKAAAYWEATQTATPFLLPRDYPEGTNQYKDLATETISIDKPTTHRLLNQVPRPFNTQINDILLTALQLTIQKHYNTPTVTIDLESHGREEITPGANISRTIGWFTSIYPVTLTSTGNDLSTTIKTIKETLRNIPNKGIDYLLWQQTNNQAASPSQICFNYLGQFDSDLENKSYQLATENPGPEHAPGDTRTHDWDITGIVSNGALQMSLSYSQNQYEQKNIQTLLQTYKTTLEQIITHCCTQSRQELTPSDLTHKTLPQATLDQLQKHYDLADIYPLSPMQEGMLFHTLLDKNSGNYLEQMAYRLKGHLDIAAVEAAMNQIMSRYDILRTLFLNEGYERPIQIVLKERKISFLFKDIRSECLNGSNEETIQKYKMEERGKPFDLGKDTLMRLAILQTGDEEFELIWNHHHVLMDGWCIGIIVKEFYQLYAAQQKGQAITLPEAIPYSRYIEWLEQREQETSKYYWKDYLSTYTNLSSPPQKKRPPENTPYNPRAHQLTIGEATVNQLRQLSRKYGVTLNTLFQAAWGILLSRYNNTDDVIFGSVVSGRPSEIEGVETMIGLFINTIPVRIRYTPEDTIANLLQQLQQQALESEAHHYHPLSEIQSLSEPGANLLDHIITFENYPEIEPTDTEKPFEITDINFFVQTHYDFNITVAPSTTLDIRFDYNAHAYDSNTIEQISRHLDNALSALSANPEARVVELSPFTPEEQEQAKTHYSTPQEQPVTPIQTMLQKSIAAHSNQTAIEYQGTSLSYAALAARALKISAALSDHHISQGSTIGILCIQRDWLISTMLAILDNRLTFMILEPGLPPVRLSSMIAQSQTQYIITDQPEQYHSTLTIDQHITWLNIAELSNQADTRADTNTKATLFEKHPYQLTDPVYVYFTSGSTGQPKGVTGNNQGLSHFINWEITIFNIDASYRISQFTNPGFDVFMRDTLVPLCSGATICIPGEEDLSSGSNISRWIDQQQITLIHSVPSLFKLFSKNTQPQHFPKLKYILLAGEKILPYELKDWYKTFGNNIQLVNIYGPTETTLAKGYYPIQPQDSENHYIPIKPIPGAQFILLNDHGQLSPQGAAGEIHIRTPYRTAGYLDPEANKNTFILNPFSEDKNDLLYKTGDIGIAHEEGKIEIVGRRDQQVKVRGIRIELDDIKENLLRYPGISEAAVAIKEDKDAEQIICAYYVAEITIEESELRTHLNNLLPAHMVPNHLVPLAELPRLPNGKINRKQLPDPVIKKESEVIVPSNEVEEKLADIWSEILGIDKELISVNRSFFELGGHSLKVLTLINKIKKCYEIQISLKDVIDKKNIRNIANYLIIAKQIEVTCEDGTDVVEMSI